MCQEKYFSELDKFAQDTKVKLKTEGVDTLCNKEAPGFPKL